MLWDTCVCYFYSGCACQVFDASMTLLVQLVNLMTPTISTMSMIWVLSDLRCT